MRRLATALLCLTFFTLLACGQSGRPSPQGTAPSIAAPSPAAAAPREAAPAPLSASQELGGCVKPADAAGSVGKRVIVCGLVSDASYQPRTNGQPTFINFDRPFPNHTFTAVIWTEDRSKFVPPPEAQFGPGKNVCITGAVAMYRGKPQIVVRSTDQIKVC